jgi:peptidoglycan/LPS O-acetylase OafA/YrhL
MFLRGATFSNEFYYPSPLRLGTNGPLWSLSYEAAYYAIFGAAVFLSGTRRIAVVVILLVLAGPRIILLMPTWLLGVWFWKQIAAGKLQDITLPVAIVCSILGPALYVASQAFDVPDQLGQLTASALGLPHAGLLLRFSDEFIWNGLIAVFTVVHLIGMTNILRSHDLTGRSIRWLAGASFSIYVTHYPALHLLDASLPEQIFGRHALMLIGSLAAGFIFAEVFERTLGPIRDVLRKIRAQPVKP